MKINQLIAKITKEAKRHQQLYEGEKCFNYYTFTNACAEICDGETNSDSSYIVLRDLVLELLDPKYDASKKPVRFLGLNMLD